jgi:hypothetical protein
MASPPLDRAGLLIVRVWIEGDRESGMRARITRTLDLSTRDEVVTTTTSVEEIVATVHAWLDSFVGGCDELGYSDRTLTEG